MEVAAALAVALIALAVAMFIIAPLRRSPGAQSADGEDPAVAELNARKEAKYREIRDAELDRAAGKLSDEDWRRQDAELRQEAVEILKELDRVGRRRGGG